MDERLIRLKTIRALKDAAGNGFDIYISFARKEVQAALDKLSSIDPKDEIAIARLQQKICDFKYLVDEYENCEKLIFNLDADKNSANNNDIGGLVPPKQETK